METLRALVPIVVVALTGLVLHGCTGSTSDLTDYFISTSCSFAVDKEVRLIEGNELTKLTDKCKIQMEGAAKIGTAEQAQAVQSVCLNQGSKQIEDAIQKTLQEHTDTCVANAKAAANTTGGLISALADVITNYVDKNKDKWANQTATIMDTAINTAVSEATNALKANATATRLFSVSGVVTQAASGSSTSFLAAAMAFATLGSATVLACRRVIRQDPEAETDMMEESTEDGGI